MRKTSWLAMLLSLSAWSTSPRDPFQPYHEPLCTQQEELLKKWQFKGTLGNNRVRHGWLVTPQGKWLGVKPQQYIDDGQWRVRHIQEQMLELSAISKEKRCLSSQHKMMLMLAQ